VLITVESLRTDHVGAYGGRSPARPEVPVTPQVDDFARGAVVYDDAHAVTSWTLAAHASLFTGLYPTAHQTTGPRDRLDASYPTLAEVLREHGYQTVGIVSGPYLRRPHGLDQGFEIYDDGIASPTNRVAHDDVTNPRMETALRRFVEDGRDPDRPFFLFAYFWDPHFDYLPPPPYYEMFVGPDAEPIDVTRFDTSETIHPGITSGELAYVLAQYAGELRWTDEHLGRFFELLREHDLWRNTVIILTADHGEEFFDHGSKGHKNNVFAETVKVPLIVKYANQSEGRRDVRVVSQIDVLPTILELAGLEATFPHHGRSLLQPDPGRDRPIFYELLSVRYYRRPDGTPESRVESWMGARRGDYKLVWSRRRSGPPPAQLSPPSYQLFNVKQDPAERNDLAAEEAERRAELEEVFRDGIGRARRDASRYRRGGTAQLAPEELEQLRELGYLDG
jgi:arylsulfatase A-like enzyme